MDKKKTKRLISWIHACRINCRDLIRSFEQIGDTRNQDRTVGTNHGLETVLVMIDELTRKRPRAKDPAAPKSKARKVKEFEQEFEQELLSQVPPATREANDFIVTSIGPNRGLLVTPTDDGAKSFLRKTFAFSEDYLGASVVVKHRDWPSILWLIQADGMTVWHARHVVKREASVL